MRTLDDFLQASQNRAKIYKNFRGKADQELSQVTIICIPDIHLLEKGPTDDFFDGKEEHVDRLLSFLDFLVEHRDHITPI
jgi:hypothetical protein